jgi:two-component system, LytTR family, response regulator
LAYLVNLHGALCSNGELLAILWEDQCGEESKKEYYKKLRMDLRKQLEDKGLGEVLLQQRGMLGIASDLIDCDYYDWLEGRTDTGNIYQDQYMSQYSWSENIINTL